MNLIVIAILLLTVGSAAAQSDDRPRVFIEESSSWEIDSDPITGGSDKKGRIYIGGGSTTGGAKPRTAEIMNRFNSQCKSCLITMYKNKADFIVRLDHEGGKDLLDKDNKLAVFNRDGDLIASGTFSRSKKAVEVACRAIEAEAARSQSRPLQNSDN